MTIEKIREALMDCHNALVNRGGTSTELADKSRRQTAHFNYLAGIDHCLWMCKTALAMPEEDRDKAMRWLCFVQGFCWSVGIFSIDEMRDQNR